MRKIVLGISIFGFVLVMALFTVRAFADDRPGKDKRDDDNRNHNMKVFNPDKQLSKSACGNDLKNPVIDITQKVQNDVDSGMAGNYWAFDYYTRHIKVWETAKGESSNTYCAIVTYAGKFYTVPGQIGPGNTPVGALINSSTNEPVNGLMSGGRRATITGTLLSSSLWSTNGSVGTTNYQCDILGNCPGFVSWTGQYFNAGYTYTDDWWGWKYNGGFHGTWINALSGNSGNIL